MTLQALRAADASLSKRHTPRAYNRAMRQDLQDQLYRGECRAEYDKAEALGEHELGRWARAWGEAIRCDLRGRGHQGAY